MRSSTLHKTLAGLLVLMAAALAVDHFAQPGPLLLATPARVVAGFTAGVLIGAVAALMGVAGGELLIPTIVLLYTLDIKTAGSLSLAVSLPTMLVAFSRYSRDRSFSVLREHTPLIAAMVTGSVTGSLMGGLAVGIVPDVVLVPVLVVLLLVSAAKVGMHA
jgi:uncharacterized membrane protein YfcA